MGDQDDREKPAGFNRGEFVKRLAFGTFAVPAIASFKLDSLSRDGSWPGQYGPNQTYPNQTYPADPEARLLQLVFRLLGFGRGV